MHIAREMQVDVLHRHHLRIAAAGRAPPLMPNTGPREGSRSAITAFLPMRAMASPRPIVVVVLPSPAGVGIDSRHEDQLSVRLSPHTAEKSLVQLRLVAANTAPAHPPGTPRSAANVSDRLHLRLLRYPQCQLTFLFFLHFSVFRFQRRAKAACFDHYSTNSERCKEFIGNLSGMRAYSTLRRKSSSG